MLERLMNNIDLYQKKSDGCYNKNYVIKLINNYRSHPAILEVPNKLFYDNELCCKGDALINIATGADGWQYLQNPDVPVIFHNVLGQNERESSSPRFVSVKLSLGKYLLIFFLVKQLFQRLRNRNGYKIHSTITRQ